MGKIDPQQARYFAGITALIAVSQSIFAMQFTELNVALASIAADLHAGPNLVPWIISSYLLAYGGVLVLGGQAADRFGRRRFCIFGLSLFGVAMLVSMLAPNLLTLIFASAVAGFATALFGPASFSLINVSLPAGPVRNRAFAVYTLTMGIVQALSFFGAGLMTTYFGWRSVFLLNLPFVVAAIFLSVIFIPFQESTGQKPGLDMGGAALITATAAFAFVSLSAMSKYGWMSWEGVGLLAIAALALGMFLLLENNLRDPLIPPSLYKHVNFLPAAFASVAVFATVGCIYALLNLFMQRVLHFTALQSGMGMLPYSLGFMLVGRFIGHGMAKYPLRKAIIGGSVISILGTLLLAMVSAERSYALNIFPGVMLIGVSIGILVALLMAVGTASIPSSIQGVAMGLLITLQQLGLAIGVTVGITVISAAQRAGDTAVMAFREGFLAAVGLAFIGLLGGLMLSKKSKPSAVVLAS